MDLDLHALGARVVGFYGAFYGGVLIAMPADKAAELFPEPFDRSGRTDVIGGAEREVEALRQRDPELGDSAMAACVIALAYQIENPYNSATSKSMCAREMRETLDRLRELAPPQAKGDDIDSIRNDLAAQRAKRARSTEATS